MSARLTKLQVTDFRSIRGTIDVPLDAPVVLIHGPNGSGKTSLLSAIELALTGAVASLGRFDDTYKNNLIHFEAADSSIAISANHEAIERASTELTIIGGRIHGNALLSEAQKRFYTERSFLAQATLSRLLEIYETSDARETASPLTRFVNDLLGLDQLDALVEGLKPSADKRRLVKSLPLYGDAEAELREYQSQVEKLKEESEAVKSDLKGVEENALEALTPFGIASLEAIDGNRSQLGDAEAEHSESASLAELKRDIEAAIVIWRRVEPEAVAAGQRGAEHVLAERRSALETWAAEEKPGLEATLERSTNFHAHLPTAQSIGWRSAHEAAAEALSEENERLGTRIVSDENVRKQITDSDEALKKASERGERLEEQLVRLAAESGDLARALSEIAPHINDEICPVCQRDFSEVSKTSLHAHLTTHIAALSQTSSQIQSLTTERQNTRQETARHQKNLSALRERLLTDSELSALRTRKADISEILQKLTDCKTAAEKGDELESAVKEASERLSGLRRDIEALDGTRQSASTFVGQLGLEAAPEEEGTEATLTRCLSYIDGRIATLMRREVDRRKALDALERRNMVTRRFSKLTSDLTITEAAKKRIDDAIKEVNKLRREVKQLSDRAIESRTSIVRDVFNESLNKIWNNLFIRLAPEEPFLPAFELPESRKGPVEAKLITRYRGDDRGGNPKAMLSAGNLNTAALTLFLSLHLSVKPLLPWLVIDDPVQSMDEIHIAQFAALLRTLSKQRKRQVIIAVHERPLFEYLSLELSPASLGDKLITIELSKNAEGSTICNPHPIVWDPARVYHAAAGQ